MNPYNEIFLKVSDSQVVEETAVFLFLCRNLNNIQGAAEQHPEICPRSKTDTIKLFSFQKHVSLW